MWKKSRVQEERKFQTCRAKFKTHEEQITRLLVEHNFSLRAT
jgi:hypothetical protein